MRKEKIAYKMIFRLIIRDLKKYIQLKMFQSQWEICRGDNYTQAGTIFPINKVRIGKGTYGTLNIHYYNQPEEKIVIGRYCSIAENVHFYTGGEHDFHNLSTYPFKNRMSKNNIQEAITKGPIEIGDDVWIGANSIILSGVKIGKGAVIGAGSVVARDVPKYGIFLNNKPVKFRFDKEIRAKLEQFDCFDMSLEDIEDITGILYTNVNEDNIDSIIESIKKVLIEKKNIESTE